MEEKIKHRIQTYSESKNSFFYKLIKKIILDPVMVAKGGTKLIDQKSIEIIRSSLMKKVTLITPNIPEAEILSKTKIIRRLLYLNGKLARR